MKKTKIISRILAALTTISVLSVPVYAGELTPYVCEDYKLSSEGFTPTFKQLLEMSDEEFIANDTYNGDLEPDCVTLWQAYHFCMRVLNGSNCSMRKFEEETGIDVSNAEDFEKLKEAVKEKGMGYLESLSPFYFEYCKNNNIDDISDGVTLIKEELPCSYTINSSTFLHIDFEDMEDMTREEYDALNQEVDSVWLAKKLNEYFGDEISYTCYRVQTMSGVDTGQVKIEFDNEGRQEFNKENVLYNARILCCLSDINAAVSVNFESDNGSGISVEEFDSTVKVGDANGDGAVTVSDCAQIARKLAKQDKSFSKWVDYNVDGKVTVSDAATIARDLAKK